MADVFSAIRAENKAIYKDWEDSPFFQTDTPQQNPATASGVPPADTDKAVSYIAIYRCPVTHEYQKTKSDLLLEEAVYFILLNELAHHVVDYFNSIEAKDMIKDYRREDIPAFLLKNRVYNLLSTPIEQRDIFLKATPRPENVPDGELCALQGSDGSMYSQMLLTLPKKSNITHLEDGSIHIDTQRVSITLNAQSTNFAKSVDKSFLELYIGKSNKHVECHKFDVNIKCKIKLLSLITRSGWNYYHWVDSFRTKIAQKIDFDTFINSINWRSTKTLIHSMQILNSRTNKTATRHKDRT